MDLEEPLERSGGWAEPPFWSEDMDQLLSMAPRWAQMGMETLMQY